MGTYNNYLDGEVDGLSHWDEAQTDRHGEMIRMAKPVIPYMVPTISFGAIWRIEYASRLMRA